MGFNAKNLSYESQEPSFLRKLKSEYGGDVSGRHERPLARPRKLKDEADDDGPTYVDEGSHNTISKVEYEAMLNGDGNTVDDGGAEIISKTVDTSKIQPRSVDESIGSGNFKEQKVAGIGSSGKRRIAKVIGEDEHLSEMKGEGKASAVGKRAKKPKKRIKLSFEEVVADT
ncbi:hypothetical protein MMC24_003948 [Lignoscripta atroalba]|nr:hypothetical protein [Lignoscripta atroalba]